MTAKLADIMATLTTLNSMVEDGSSHNEKTRKMVREAANTHHHLRKDIIEMKDGYDAMVLDKMN